VIIALAPALVFTIFSRNDARRVAEAQARENVLRVARIAADRHQRLLESTQQMLFLLSRLPALRSGDLEACARLFADLIRQYPRYANLGIAELDGSIGASGIPLSQPYTAAGHPWFQRLAENPDLEPAEYQLDEISGKPAVFLSHPVLDGSGKMKFVAFAALDLGWVNQIFNAAQFPPGSVMTVSDAGGKILARTLDAGKWAGASGPEAVLLKEISPGRDATGESPGVDGTRRIYAFTQLPGRGVEAVAHVSVGIPTEAAYAAAEAAPYRNLTVLGLSALFALAAALLTGEVFVGRGLRNIRKTVQLLQGGDLSARTGTMAEAAELRETAGAIDNLAQTSRERAEESRRALETSRESEARLRLVADHLPMLAWSTNQDLSIGLLLGEGLAGQKPQEANYRGLNISTCLQAIAPDFEATQPHSRVLQGVRMFGEIHHEQGTAHYLIAPLKNPKGEIEGCVGMAWEDEHVRQAVRELKERAGQLNQALDAAIGKLGEYRNSEEAMQQEIRHLKDALRGTAQELAKHVRNEELLQQRELEFKEFLESAGTEASRASREAETLRGELEQARRARESAAAEAERSRAQIEELNRNAERIASDLQAAVALNAELKRREKEAREGERQARESLETLNADLGRRTETDEELRESAKQIKFALEAAAGEVTELQEEVEALRESEKQLRESLHAAELKNRDLHGALQSAVTDLEQRKRTAVRSHPKDTTPDRNALAEKLNEEASGSLATIKTGLEAMQKMAGKSPLARRLKESIETLESTRHRLRIMAKGLSSPGGA
jgi:hypothetical protein